MRKVIIIVVLELLSVSAVWADFAPTTPGDILSQYHAAAVTWEAKVFGYAQDLFYLLAVIELSWTFLELFLQQADLQTWMFGFMRSIMAIIAFYALLLYGEQVVSRCSQQLYPDRRKCRGNPVDFTNRGVYTGSEDCGRDDVRRQRFRFPTAHRIGDHDYSVRNDHSAVLGPGDTEPDHYLGRKLRGARSSLHHAGFWR